MPFNFKKFRAQAESADYNSLQDLYNHHIRKIVSAAASTSIATGQLPFTLGWSGIAYLVSTPTLYNSARKLRILHSVAQNRSPPIDLIARKRDIAIALGITGTTSAATFGLLPGLADWVGDVAIQHGLDVLAQHLSTQAFLEASSGLILEEAGGEAAEKGHELHSAKKWGKRI